MDDDLKAVNHRPCNDEEYGQQKHCWTCSLYSFKAYASDDQNEGKCFVFPFKTLWVKGNDICDKYKGGKL